MVEKYVHAIKVTTYTITTAYLAQKHSFLTSKMENVSALKLHI